MIFPLSFDDTTLEKPTLTKILIRLMYPQAVILIMYPQAVILSIEKFIWTLSLAQPESFARLGHTQQHFQSTCPFLSDNRTLIS